MQHGTAGITVPPRDALLIIADLFSPRPRRGRFKLLSPSETPPFSLAAPLGYYEQPAAAMLKSTLHLRVPHCCWLL